MTLARWPCMRRRLLAGAALVGARAHAAAAVAAPSIRRSRATRGSPSGWRGWCRSTSTTRSASFAPTARPPRSRSSAGPASSGWRSRLARARRARSRLERARSSSASPTCSSPRAIACRSSTAATWRGICGSARSWQASDGVMVDRPRRQRRLRSGGLLRRQPLRLRLLQGVHRRRASSASRALGPVLGSYHPVVAENVARLQEISGLDEVSFHMSGTEAVMQAVRLARYHTGRSHLVRFCGAYHGWWDGVQPGVGNPRAARATSTR